MLKYFESKVSLLLLAKKKHSLDRRPEPLDTFVLCRVPKKLEKQLRNYQNQAKPVKTQFRTHAKTTCLLAPKKKTRLH